MKQRIRTVISLYTGVGGLDFGFEAAGYETRVAIELDSACCKNLRANRDWPVIEGDINHVNSDQILEASGLAAGEADILIGGPPCQPFSKSGYWAKGDSRRLNDPRASTLSSYFRVLKDTLPKVFLMENVPGLAFRGKDEGMQTVADAIEAINSECGTNYRPYSAVVNAADFGVPQMRERLIVIGARDGTEFIFPSPTHASSEQSKQTGLEPHRTTWDALGDLPAHPNEPGIAMTGKWADLLPSVPEGQNYLWHTERGGGLALFGWRRRYWNFLLKLAKDRPSWTIQAQPGSATGPFHWNNRKLSVRELCRLQTFPDSLELIGSRNDVQRLIGNAVPSLLSEVLAREIRVQLFAEARTNAPLSLLPPSRHNTPPPEEVYDVPAKYVPLEGKHTPHPGTGKGYAASQRFA